MFKAGDLVKLKASVDVRTWASPEAIKIVQNPPIKILKVPCNGSVRIAYPTPTPLGIEFFNVSEDNFEYWTKYQVGDLARINLLSDKPLARIKEIIRYDTTVSYNLDYPANISIYSEQYLDPPGDIQVGDHVLIEPLLVVEVKVVYRNGLNKPSLIKVWGPAIPAGKELALNSHSPVKLVSRAIPLSPNLDLPIQVSTDELRIQQFRIQELEKALRHVQFTYERETNKTKDLEMKNAGLQTENRYLKIQISAAENQNRLLYRFKEKWNKFRSWLNIQDPGIFLAFLIAMITMLGTFDIIYLNEVWFNEENAANRIVAPQHIPSPNDPREAALMEKRAALRQKQWF